MGVYSVGRSTKADIMLADTSVSRNHAELETRDDGRFRVVDLESTFGTFIHRNGKWTKVSDAMLNGDDLLRLGNLETTPKKLLDTVGTTTQPVDSARQTDMSSGVRKLAAILAADIVGYSKLMGEDEAGTLAALKHCRRELFDPTIERHRGRIFKVIGDGILAEFSSVVDAVEGALGIQTAMMRKRFGRGDGIQLVFRIGINLGDVIADGDDIYGDGVNIAARLEALAEPGGISVSGPVYDQIKNKLHIGYEDLGEQRAKNIADPIRVYKVYSTASGRVIPS
jgi:class 3 adenylate cyclase